MWCTRLENEHWGTKIDRKVAHTDYSKIAKKNSKRVIQKDVQGNVLKIWDSLAQISREMGYSSGNISMACNGKYNKPLYGCYWSYLKAT